jgi:alpha-glucosidase
MSSFPIPGSDIGGFAEQPSELYARWIQLGVFHPFEHTRQVIMGIRSRAFDEEVIDITRNFVNLRYVVATLPIYYVLGNILREKIPMLKPLVYYDQSDIQTHYRNDEFIFGNQILVCPILEPNAIGRRMYILAVSGIITGIMIL